MGSVSKRASVVVITGEYGSGKTSFCRNLQYSLPPETAVLNVGSVLEAKLLEKTKRAYFAMKAEIGPAFLREFRRSDVARFVVEDIQRCLRSGRSIVIIDGVRLLETYLSIKKTERVLLHVHLKLKREVVRERQLKYRSKMDRHIYRRYYCLERQYDADLYQIQQLADMIVLGSDMRKAAMQVSRRIQGRLDL